MKPQEQQSPVAAMKVRELDVRKGSKTSSSLMAEDMNPDQLEQFMRTSFYLPIDVLKNENWFVRPVAVVKGSYFRSMKDYWGEKLHCQESCELLASANWVGLSERYNKKTRQQWIVAKIWYGAVNGKEAA